MATHEAGAGRRHRLLTALQDKALEDAIEIDDVRDDIAAEAAAGDDRSLLSPGVLAHLRELAAEKARLGLPEGRGERAARQSEFFFSNEAAVVVPGFLASALGDTSPGGRGPIWVNPAAVLSDRLGALQLAPYDGNENDLDPNVRVAATGPLPIVYDLLRLGLEVRRYATEIFPVDWRKDLDIASRLLAARLRGLTARGRPVHLIAHSQGALVARRALQLLGDAEARRAIRHVVLLGPANFGSMTAALGLGGGDSVMALAERIAVAPKQGFAAVLASMSGLYQLLPWDAARLPWLRENDIGSAAFWGGFTIDAARLAKFHGWGGAIGADLLADRTTLILGDDGGVPTAGGVNFESGVARPSPAHGMAGDGVVAHSCAVLPGARVVLAKGAEHSTMALRRSVIDAVAAILADRPVNLPPLSADPADHLGRSGASRVVVMPPAAVARVLQSTAPPLPGRPLNGAFLSGYDGGLAEPEPGAVGLSRQEQIRDYREELGVFRASTIELQATPPVADPCRASLLELILDASNLLPFDFLRTGDRLGRAVVKIERADGAAGTGFLVAPGVLLTNNHVLPDPATASTSRAIANYETNPPDDPAGAPAVAPLDPAALFVTNADLDFTFCAVTGLDHLGAVPLNRNSLNVMTSEYVNIIQHPRGRPKEVVVQDNRVVRADNVVVQYSCDTEPGSSGSPVFNNQWKLVALHHASVVAPEVGRPAPGGAATARYLNEGVRVSAIATWLETSEAASAAGGGGADVERLRSIFGGLDPQTGFFGALGRKAEGRSAAEVVVESYRGAADDLDVAYWDLRGADEALRDRPHDVARALADMNLDLWCLDGITGASARALRIQLETCFRLEYDIESEPPRGLTGLVVLRKRVRDRAPGPRERIGGGDGPPPVSARVATRRGESADVRLVVAPGPARDGEDPAANARALAEAIGREARELGDDAGADWLVVGDPAAIAAADAGESVWALTGLEPTVLAAGADGAVVRLAGPRSRVERLFASPNLRRLSGPSDRLTVVTDRRLPRAAESLGLRRPVAVRLSLAAAPPPEPPPHPWPDAAALEEKLRSLLAPILARLLADSGLTIRD